ncbi:MAG: Fe2+-dependent dioxygenase [Gammaproteobacteria bacterium]|nr:Fe2+-dependent dioxygenase [Gammaproteobacteria bacterium]MDJ0873066.1 Fe2+-dependent dioxygenase [Gammaproteobacteria bacterium]
MLYRISNVLGRFQLDRVTAILAEARFVDGRLSAGMAAKRVKHNQELDPSSGDMATLNNMVMGALVSHPTFKSAVLPHRVAAPFYARYAPGMRYGDHVDDPVMGPTGGRYRSDVSVTVFLNDGYEGGELVVQTAFGPREIKLPAGDAVVYPSSSLHHVAEVIGGERLVAVTWAQSMVRDVARRELLHELNQARDKLLKERPDADETRQVDTAYVNLIRMWAEV